MARRMEELSKFQKVERLGAENYNNQGCLMKIIQYNSSTDIVIEFQDEYKTKIKSAWKEFSNGGVKNPYYPEVYGVGMVGNKYPTTLNHKQTKDYEAWYNILQRCFDKNVKNKKRYLTYQDVTCCDEWLLFENFYEWLHSQNNYDKWLNGDKWAVDKDILIKGNKIYSPKTCCLVSHNVNGLFLKHNSTRGNLPIGVSVHGKGFQARCHNPIINKEVYIGMRYTPLDTFLLYKKYKEDLIKQVAQIEYDNGNIIKECYEAMMNYEVEITD